MNLSQRGLAELASHEALVTRRYRDSQNVWTAGIGETAAAGNIKPIEITEDRPVEFWVNLFKRTVASYAAAVARVVKVPVTQYEFDALTSFHYNTGAIGRASLVKALNAGDRPRAASLFMSYKKPSEIIGRRSAEMNLFRTGQYAAKPMLTVFPSSDKGAVLWSRGKSVPALPLFGPTEPATPLKINHPTLRLGDKGPSVAEWQRLIGIDDDGDFGPKTDRATKSQQILWGLVPDGAVGPKTWSRAIKA